MKNLLLFLFCTIWSIGIFAQHELNQQYLIYLYDGSFLKGELVAEDEQSIQIKIISGEILTLSSELVQKISRNKKHLTLINKGITIQEKGSYHIFSGGMLFGKATGFSDTNPVGFSLNYIRGYQFNKYVALGAGLSIDDYDKTFIPIYVDFRGYLFQKRASLFYAMNAGYSFETRQFKKDRENTYYRGGLILNPSLGLRLSGKQNHSFMMGIGYRFQFAQRENIWSEFVDKIIYKRLSFNLGFIF